MDREYPRRMALRYPRGQSDFLSLRAEGAYYVDKTAFVREVLAEGDAALLVLRPRRFGKTLNLSTLRWFLENDGAPVADAFAGLSVWDDAGARLHFQRHPVITLTFKDVKTTTSVEFERRILALVAAEFRRHGALASSSALEASDRARFSRMAAGELDIAEAEEALLELSRWLHVHHGERVAILIDEYDTPIHAGVVHGFAERAADFLRNFLSGGLKDNPHLYRGVLTGILRIAKESLFSGLNNLAVFGPTRPEFGADFGFTADEVAALLERAGRPELLEPMTEWYDGYDAQGRRLFNPWSVMSFMRSADKALRPYWVATGSEDLLRRVLLQPALVVRISSCLRSDPASPASCSS